MSIKVTKHGVFEQLRREELGRLEPGSDIYRRLARKSFGEAILSKDLIHTWEELMMEGNTVKNAARVVGVSQKTMNRWIKQGCTDIENETLTLEAEFTWMVDRCQGEQERMLSRAAFRYAMSERADGTLAVKILERRNAEEWAPALPDTPDAAAQYVGMQAAQLKAEVRRVLQTAAHADETTVEPLPAKLESSDG